ncbi:unnamed protein product [Symbiodinium microadriaticum]|nr:unnamed protein product [Symbiodinium microadriaticum]
MRALRFVRHSALCPSGTVRRGTSSFSFPCAVSAVKVEVRVGDLVSDGGFSDVIVNSANETLEGPLFPYFPIGAECESGDVYYQDDVVDGRIHKAGGPALGRLCRRLPELPPEDDPDGPFPSPYTQRCEIGGARLTKVPEGGELVQHCQYVAHAVVPIWAGDLDLEEQNRRLSLLTKAYASAFAAAASSSSPVRRICSPLLGAGAKSEAQFVTGALIRIPSLWQRQFPIDLAARCASEAARRSGRKSGRMVRYGMVELSTVQVRESQVILELRNPTLMDLEVIAFIDRRKDCVDHLIHEAGVYLATSRKRVVQAVQFSGKLNPDFRELEEALEEGLWEVEGDNLYFAVEAKDASSAGAVVASDGGVGSIAELVHQLNGGHGCQVTRLTMAVICKAIDIDSNGTFTIGLAFDDDFEETALLAVTIRRPRPEPRLPREPGDPPEEPEMPKPIALHLNGQVRVESCQLRLIQSSMVRAAIGRQVAAEDVGDLPVKIEFDVQLSWDEATQPALRVLRSDSMSGAISALLRQEQRFFDTGLSRKVPSCKLALEAAASDDTPCEVEAMEAHTTCTGFYTTDIGFDLAKAVFLRATGTVRVRLLSLECQSLCVDQQCPVCWNLLCEPVAWPGCPHHFCLICALRTRRKPKPMCPLCRAPASQVRQAGDLQVNAAHAVLIRKAVGYSAYESQRRETWAQAADLDAAGGLGGPLPLVAGGSEAWQRLRLGSQQEVETFQGQKGELREEHRHVLVEAGAACRIIELSEESEARRNAEPLVIGKLEELDEEELVLEEGPLAAASDIVHILGVLGRNLQAVRQRWMMTAMLQLLDEDRRNLENLQADGQGLESMLDVMMSYRQIIRQMDTLLSQASETAELLLPRTDGEREEDPALPFPESMSSAHENQAPMRRLPPVSDEVPAGPADTTIVTAVAAQSEELRGSGRSEPRDLLPVSQAEALRRRGHILPAVGASVSRAGALPISRTPLAFRRNRNLPRAGIYPRNVQGNQGTRGR